MDNTFYIMQAPSEECIQRAIQTVDSISEVSVKQSVENPRLCNGQPVHSFEYVIKNIPKSETNTASFMYCEPQKGRVHVIHEWMAFGASRPKSVTEQIQKAMDEVDKLLAVNCGFSKDKRSTK